MVEQGFEPRPAGFISVFAQRGHYLSAGRHNEDGQMRAKEHGKGIVDASSVTRFLLGAKASKW